MKANVLGALELKHPCGTSLTHSKTETQYFEIFSSETKCFGLRRTLLNTQEKAIYSVQSLILDKQGLLYEHNVGCVCHLGQ